MPHSSDDPPSAPTASAENEAPSATSRTLRTASIPPAPSSQAAKPVSLAGAGVGAADPRPQRLRQEAAVAA